MVGVAAPTFAIPGIVNPVTVLVWWVPPIAALHAVRACRARGPVPTQPELRRHWR